MAKARAFDAYEQAFIVPLFPEREPSGEATADQSGRGMRRGETGAVSASPAPRYRVPEPFPRDPSELPEYEAIAQEAFLRSLEESNVLNGERRVREQAWVGRHFERGDVGQGGSDAVAEERREQALNAARELMASYGRLEAELRVVQELESARGKMLREMCRLHAELSGCDRPRSSPAAAGPTGTMPSLPSVPGRNIASSKLPSPVRNSSSRGNPGARSAVPSSTKGSPLTPFLTCLSAKPREQQMEALSAIKSARESIERAAEERAYRDSWCRWIISALEAENSRDPSSAGGVKDSARSSGERGRDSGSGSGLRASGGVSVLEEHPEEGVAGDSEEDSRGHHYTEQLEALCEQLENKLRAIPRPRAVYTSDELIDLSMDSLPDDLRRAIDGVHGRLGADVDEAIQALEAEVGFWTEGRREGSGTDEPEAFLSGEKDRLEREISPSAGEGGETWARGGMEEMEWATREELEDLRQRNRDVLGALLSAHVEAMPLVPRGGGW